MANKREFKKYAEAVGASVCEAMMFSYYNEEGVNKDEIAKAIEKVLGGVAAARSNANITFDKGVKAFPDLKSYSKEKNAFYVKLFDKINEEFNKSIDEAVKQFNAAIPQNVKEENKKAVTE